MAAHPGKLSSLVIKNNLNVKEIWADSINVKKTDGKFDNILKIIDTKLEDMKKLELTLNKSMMEINNVINELKHLKSMPSVTTPVKGDSGQSGENGKKGDTGSPGPIGPQGKPGKGIKGPKGDSIISLAAIPDIDTSTLVDGSVLVWSADKKKWISQNLADMLE